MLDHTHLTGSNGRTLPPDTHRNGHVTALDIGPILTVTDRYVMVGCPCPHQGEAAAHPLPRREPAPQDLRAWLRGEPLGG
jgi:hypothetical protein